MKKVISILGSPRKKGTSARIAGAFTDTAQSLGAEVEKFYLNGMTYRGCQACETCHSETDKCVLKDDVTEVLEAINEADIVVFSSPVYYGDTSGQFKLFYDRMYSLLDIDIERDPAIISRVPEGKTAIFVVTQGDINENFRDVPERYKMFLEVYGYDVKVVRRTDLQEGVPNQDVSDSQAEIVALAKELIV